MPGQTRDSQYTQTIRQLAACSDLQLLPEGAREPEVMGEYGLVCGLMSGCQMNKPRAISDLKRIYKGRMGVQMTGAIGYTAVTAKTRPEVTR